MNIIKALEWRYATKKFDPNKALPKNKLEILKNAFNLTATSYGLQPVKLLIINDRALQSKLKEHSWNQPQVEDASHLLVFCVEQNIGADYIKKYFERVKNIRNTPEKVLEPFQNFLIEDFENKTAEEIQQWAEKQVYLAMGNLLTVCAVENIDACPMEGFSSETYDKLLNLNEKHLRSVLVMPVGYRAEDDMFAEFKKVRKPMSDSVVELS
ncbi:NAD(P)H-dependent oxidoreductase [Galbibacter sp. EGI 63066]|uniref:NAD(P)H-dependent oxidoreductase n=1 Tax=Galbibacter sp. EGI 63066 TaxID=2993559 RepID=UPI0022488095|nr:NAD(P)H-dependent oxidoreductase [Galbibacter sp. EGI 63066]MCX2678703.1 NAD(P)H-dependent oxidoreductase [Galbibacter sp. EGI 63066]